MAHEESVKIILQSLGRMDSIHQLVLANIRLWHSWTSDSATSPWRDHPYSVQSETALLDCAFAPDDAFSSVFIPLIRKASLLLAAPSNRESSPSAERPLLLHRRIFDPDAFVSAFIPSNLVRDEDRNYFVRAAIRRIGRLRWNAEARQSFGLLSGCTPSDSSKTIGYNELRSQLLHSLAPLVSPDNCAPYVDAYLATLRMLRMLVPEQPRGRVRISPDAIDTEYLVSSLFGVSSGVRGLDQLFGGAGPILPDYILRGADSLPHSDDSGATCLTGRTILVRGPTGSGKTLLACHLAASVAGKGGIANIVSAEQGPEEYLYTLSTMGLTTPAGGFRLAFSEEERLQLRADATPKEGAIVYTGVDRDALADGLPLLKVIAERMQPYPLRLLIIDSLNGIANLALSRDIDVRGAFATAFRSVTSLGVSLLITEEEQAREGLQFEEQQNLADTVVRLSTRSELAYRKRFVQIMKLRFQREQRGEHPFSIVSGEGLHVVPSPVAVRTRVSQRRARGSRASADPIGFGVGALDAIAGTPLRPGHIVLLEGVAGTRKSLIAGAFLSALQRGDPVGTSVLLAVGDPVVSDPSGDDALGSSEPGSRTRPLKIVPRGFSSSGTVFQLLDDVFDMGLSQGKPAHRLVIDDLATLDVDAPLVSADPSFGHILCDYLHRQDTITLIVSRTAAEGESDLVRRAVATNADYHLLLTHRRGERHGHVLLTVLKSPGMRHRTGWFDVSIDNARVDIAATPTLVDLDRKGGERKLRVILYMFGDSSPHKAYNDRIAAALQSNPNLQVQVASQKPVLGSGAIGLGGRSGYGDIRIVQLDEFQVPTSPTDLSGPELFHFDECDVPSLGLHLPEVAARARIETQQRHGGGKEPTPPRQVWAVPYYCNVGLLAVHERTSQVVRKLFQNVDPRSMGFSEAEQRSWRALADHIEYENDKHRLLHRMNWQDMALLSEIVELNRVQGTLDPSCGLPQGSDDVVFFDYARSEEDHNVLFLEILLWVRSGLKLERDRPSLEGWLAHPSALTALRIFWRLLRPSFDREERRRTEQASALERTGESPGDPGRTRKTLETAAVSYSAGENSALVWRQWFTTLAESLTRLNRDEARRFVIRPLPRSCGVAGDWYLGVLADSAMPVGALRIIKTMTTPEAELERLREGIGLPTQLSYYKPVKHRHDGNLLSVDSVENEDEPAVEGDHAYDTNHQDPGQAKRERYHIIPVSSHMTIPMSRPQLRRIICKAFRRSAFSGYARKAATLSAGLRKVLEFEVSGYETGEAIDPTQVDSFLQGVLDDLVGQLTFIERFIGLSLSHSADARG